MAVISLDNPTTLLEIASWLANKLAMDLATFVFSEASFSLFNIILT